MALAVNSYAPTSFPTRHRTMIADEIIEAVASRCGMTGLGLYAYLARRVNRDGETFVNLDTLAVAFSVSIRHIRDTMLRLEAAGFIRRANRVGANQAVLGTTITLLHHPEPTPEVTPEPTPEPSCARQLKEVERSSSEVKPRKARSKHPKAPLPPDWEPPSSLRDWATAQGYTAVQIDLELLQFRNRYLHEKPENRADWTASFQNWLINGINWGKVASAPSPSGRGRRDTGLSAEEAIALALSQMAEQA